MRHLPPVCILLLLVTLCSAAIALAAPELSVDRGTFNFGTVAQGKKVQHTFTIRNNGDAPLQIKKLEASCGCTAAKPSTSIIPPGKSAEIEVTFDSGSFSGKVQKTVTLNSNAGKTPVYTFTIEGTVLDQLQVTPRQVSLGAVSSSTATQAKVSVTNNSNVTVKLLNVSATSSSLQIRPTIRKAELKPGESGTIEISVQAKPDAKILSGYLHITTSHPQRKEITVPVYGSIAK
ncbi:DUF1573 domain-containing protein [Geomonas propionica]|uniref:DUF1573 domain-containing protein n=1 Tax=Geomonas propionica TaxID=2798582 RepID=A0ABS0YTT4_9BACT|nr:DUF1573 domain-containing protein [Geomonas propionica]MBJ6801389.1 DUF1573 domain-containing protein [Geomonas propionica]